MSKTNTIEIQFTNIEPHMVGAKDLAKILTALEEMISSSVALNNTEIKKEDVRISLTEIKNKCIDITFTHNYAGEVYKEYKSIGAVIETSNQELMQKEIREGLMTFNAFNKKYSTTTKFIDNSGTEKKVFAELRELITKRTTLIKGGTVLYGTVYKVGGITTPKVGIRLSEGEDVNCDTSASIAERMGHLLYKTVGVGGVAEWDPDSLKVVKFTITEILDYIPASIGKAMSDLSGKYGKEFSDIDPIKFLKEIR